MRTSVAGSQPQRPRPDARNHATTPAIRASHPMHPIHLVGPVAPAWTDQWWMAMNALSQLAPRAPAEGKGVLWPMRAIASIPPDSKT